MEPKRKSKNIQRKNATPRVVANVAPDAIGVHTRSECTPLMSAPPISNTRANISTKNAQMPTLSDNQAPPPASFSGPSDFYRDIRGANQLLTKMWLPKLRD